MTKNIKRTIKIGMILISAIVCLLVLYIVTAKIYDSVILKKVSYMDDPKGQYVEIDGAKIYYEVYGEGKPLLIIHGFLGSTDNFKKVVPEISKENKVYLIDNIGFGHSDKNPRLDYSKKSMAQLAADFLVKMKLDNVILMGHSMGGEIALNLVLDHPDLIKGLILVDSAGHSRSVTQAPQNKLVRSIYKFAIDNLMITYPATQLTGVFYKETLIPIERVRKYEYFAVAKQADPESIIRMSEDNDSGTRKEEFSDISLPTLIIWGEHDKVIPLENAYRFESAIKNSEVVIIERAGHLPFDENTSAFLKAVKEFLE
jgi:pimeloyl-ACP methyl ester carboxylesterase